MIKNTCSATHGRRCHLLLLSLVTGCMWKRQRSLSPQLPGLRVLTVFLWCICRKGKCCCVPETVRASPFLPSGQYELPTSFVLVAPTIFPVPNLSFVCPYCSLSCTSYSALSCARCLSLPSIPNAFFLVHPTSLFLYLLPLSFL